MTLLASYTVMGSCWSLLQFQGAGFHLPCALGPREVPIPRQDPRLRGPCGKRGRSEVMAIPTCCPRFYKTYPGPFSHLIFKTTYGSRWFDLLMMLLACGRVRVSLAHQIHAPN